MVFVDGYDQALIIQTRGWPNRGISKPDTQQSVRGPKEGFTETLLFNVALLRRKIRSPKLKTEILQKGELTKTDICMVYLEGSGTGRIGGKGAASGFRISMSSIFWNPGISNS